MLKKKINHLIKPNPFPTIENLGSVKFLFRPKVQNDSSLHQIISPLIKKY